MITHKELTQRGFKLRKGKMYGYWFKQTEFGGTLSPVTSEFCFYGMSSTFITSLKDLDTIIEMIEYKR